MGGKVKQAQRTKNNSRPSNSGRSAELLGSSLSSFVGFTAHSDLGIVPLAPGFAVAESLPEIFDANISPQCQLILRKMSKKDPITKVKALQEFSELIAESDMEIIKPILPLWPKFYCSLANDVEHRVRETAQQALSAIIDKSGKMIAPYLKQLAPVWIASQFDNYAPAASLASTTFRTAFAPHKVQEVYSFCQNEILDYVSKNLLFHTASTLNNAKTYTPEEAESKYHRIIVCSMKTFSLCVGKLGVDKLKEHENKVQNILQNPKFWSFAKHKDHNIKSAWFELLYTLLQNIPLFLESNKQQVIQIVFNNIDDTNPITISHVWGCVLLIQASYDDWYTFVNFKKSVQPKLFSLIKTNYRNCASVFFPNLYPFISKLSSKHLQNSSLKDFYTDLFDSIKQSLKSLNHMDNKSVIVAITTAFYECISLVIQNENMKLSNKTEEHDSLLCESLVDKYVVEIIEWCITFYTVAAKYIFVHVSTLIAKLAQKTQTSSLYSKLLDKFWSELQRILSATSDEGNQNNAIELNRYLEFIQSLHGSDVAQLTNKVKFSADNNEGTSASITQKPKHTNPNVIRELKIIALQLARIYVEKISKEKTIEFVPQLKTLVEMFGDEDFILKITIKSDLKSAFQVLSSFLNAEYFPCESMIDIIFEVIFMLNKDEQMEMIDELLKIPNSTVQQWIIHRLLSYPLCVEPEIRKILSQDHVSEIILSFAKDFINDNSKDKFNLLHKCFFQIDSGEILIDEKTVEGIVRIISEPLRNKEMNEIVDTCGSFIAQIMPVICSSNTGKHLQKEVFLLLFKFSVEVAENENLSEDTLWEIITCWQDALSSSDIQIDEELKRNCADIIDKRITQSEELSVQNIENIADFSSKLIICSVEGLSNSSLNVSEFIDNLLGTLLENLKCKELFENLNYLCSHFESLNGIFTNTCAKDRLLVEVSSQDIKNFLRKQYHNFCTIFKCICNAKSEVKRKLSVVNEINDNEDYDDSDEEDREQTDDYIDPNDHLLKVWSDSVYKYFILSLKATSMGNSLMVNSFLMNAENENLVVNLSEKINEALHSAPDLFVFSLKKRIFSDISAEDVSSVRILDFLTYINEYFKDENGPVLLFEDATNTVLDQHNYGAYLNIIQMIFRKIPARSLPINYDIVNENVDISTRAAYLRYLVSNHFSADHNELSDRKIINFCLELIVEIDNRKNANKAVFMYDVDISKQDINNVIMIVEFVNFLTEILNRFPTQLDIKSWDLIRIGLSSWVLSISKSIEQWHIPKVSVFIASIYKLFEGLSRFISVEKTKSSTEELSNVIDEWENVFASGVNLILFKSFIHLVSCDESFSTIQVALLDVISPTIEYMDYSILFNASQSTFKYKTDDIIKFSLKNLSNKVHSVRIASILIIQKLIPFLISLDIENLEKRNDITVKINKEANNSDNWHLIHKITEFFKKHENNVEKYLADFNYKLTDLVNFQPIDRNDALSYLFLWNCVISICSNSPAELRSLYASSITENKFEQILLNFLFRCMPVEILKNHDSKVMNNEIFKTMNWNQLKDRNVSIERLACHTYTQMLKHLPAIVRKWWNATNTRQKTFIDKLTTNFVSGLICNEELRSIVNKKEKHENMQVTVHTSTREVFAVYTIDEARMELVIKLAPNYPLGAIKVESGKQIGSRAQSRNLGMQLSIFLIHQNGSIFDGLTIWKKNLDKKFEGVEECYVCYTVIHQDTCQLPKLSCKTCRKKFHGPCLYKWFTTSSKSTCPICRNVF